MIWMFTGWEVTTVCSFLLIGYTRPRRRQQRVPSDRHEPPRWHRVRHRPHVHRRPCRTSLSFNKLIARWALPRLRIVASGDAAVALPRSPRPPRCRSTHGCSAPWLPRPRPARCSIPPRWSRPASSSSSRLLLHAASIIPGYMVILVGAPHLPALLLMAISQSNAKRVLAYSTIANLGLIVPALASARPRPYGLRIFLLIFHACAKSLLFLCVGTAEHHIGSRNIEDMDGLFQTMPRLARYMMLGIMIMFIAPFGMLISKWAALQSFVDSGNLILVLLLAFGSGATFFFWAKWIGKLSASLATPRTSRPRSTRASGLAHRHGSLVRAVLRGHSRSSPGFVVRPVHRGSAFAGQYFAELSPDNLWIVGIICTSSSLPFCSALGQALPKKKHVGVYLSGISLDNENRVFKNSILRPRTATSRNWYLEGIFGEQEARQDRVLASSSVHSSGILATRYLCPPSPRVDVGRWSSSHHESNFPRRVGTSSRFSAPRRWSPRRPRPQDLRAYAASCRTFDPSAVL